MVGGHSATRPVWSDTGACHLLTSPPFLTLSQEASQQGLLV